MKNNLRAAIAVILIAATLTGCGTIKPPAIDTTVTTVPVTTETTIQRKKQELGIKEDGSQQQDDNYNMQKY